MAPLMIIASVPLYNVMAVVVLSVFKPGQGKIDGTVLKRTLKGIVTNPIILGIAGVPSYAINLIWTLPFALAAWLICRWVLKKGGRKFETLS